MAPIFERLGKRFMRRMEFVAVSVYDRPDIAGRFGVSSTPTFIVTRRGKAMRHFYGVIHERVMAEHLEPYALVAAASDDGEQKRGLLARLFERGRTD
jgi:thioredoxin-like negative regulator of GroEL